MARLVRAGDVAGLVFHPDRRRRPEAVGERRGRLERCPGEAMSVHPRNLVVETPHELDENSIAHALGGGEMVGVQQAAPGDERVLLPDVFREFQTTQVEDSAEHVVATVARSRAAERVRLQGPDRRTTSAADQGAGRRSQARSGRRGRRATAAPRCPRPLCPRPRCPRTARLQAASSTGQSTRAGGSARARGRSRSCSNRDQQCRGATGKLTRSPSAGDTAGHPRCRRRRSP